MVSTESPVPAPRKFPPAVAWLLWAVASGTHLTAQLVGADRLASVTQVMLMPCVALLLVTQVPTPHGRLVRGVLWALFFSWLGDTLPRFTEGDPAFLLMVGGFLCAQVAYCRAFWPERSRSVATTHRWTVAVAAALVVALVVVCAPEAGVMTVPVAVYGTALAAMTLLGTGINRTVGWGAVVFLVSDAMIGLGAFTSFDPPAADFWVMLTYIAGQTLIVCGVVQANRRSLSVRQPSPGRPAVA